MSSSHGLFIDQVMGPVPNAGESEPRKLDQVLLDFGFLSPQELRHARQAASENAGSLDLSPFIDAAAVRAVPYQFASEHKILPIGKFEKELLFATGKRLDLSLLHQLQSLTGLLPRPVLVMDELLETIQNCYRRNRIQGVAHTRLGKTLVDQKLLSQEQLEKCLQEQKKSGEKLGELLIRKGLVPEEAVFACLAKQLGYNYLKINLTEIDLALTKLIPKRFAQRLLVLPVRLDSKSREMVVAMADPNDLKVKDVLSTFLREHGFKLFPVLSSPDAIRRGLEYAYSGKTNFQNRKRSGESEKPVETDFELGSTVDLPEVRQMVNQVLYRAVQEKASDIHIENLESRVRVRFRIDGLLQERQTPFSKEIIGELISVLKIDAGLDITEHRRSQDGVFKRSLANGKAVDFRINVHATEFGGDAVIRLLDRSGNLLPLHKMDFPEDALAEYLKLVENPQGLVLITGPTGSGKSTTLYSTLDYLNTPERKIVTAEEPIEYHLDGVCQYQVNESIGNTFAEYGRRFLRKDPDIILIGEIRDEQTAEACIKASMSGHLVFSTLHTNDSLGVVPRLRDLKVESFSIADSLLVAVSQRLARRNCSECARSHQPDPELLHEFYPDGCAAGVTFLKGVGCSKCNGIGYAGRLGLYEFWELTPEARDAISRQEKEGKIREIAMRNGLSPLLKDALKKVESGQTTLEELRRVTPLEQIRRFAESMRS